MMADGMMIILEAKGGQGSMVAEIVQDLADMHDSERF